jgi:transcriptional regulator with XRE-family HTH domain
MTMRKTVRSRRLGKRLRRLRDDAQLRQEALAELMNADQPRQRRVSASHLSRVETGLARISADHLARIIEVLNVKPEEAHVLDALRARADQPGWWQEYADILPESVEMLVELGEDATSIRTYDTVFVQGLLQTKAYATAVNSNARAIVRPIDVDRLTELRLRRQNRLADPDFAGVTAVMTEGVIRTVVGGPDVMREQLQHLLKVVENYPVNVHVLPLTVTPPGSDSVVIFGFPHEMDGEVVYVDSDTAQRIHEDREPVRQCTYTFDAALAQALTPKASQDLIRDQIEELDP